MLPQQLGMRLRNITSAIGHPCLPETGHPIQECYLCNQACGSGVLPLSLGIRASQIRYPYDRAKPTFYFLILIILIKNKIVTSVQCPTYDTE